MPAWIPTTIYIFVAVATATLLVVHSLDIGDIQIDTTSLGLLALLLLVPLAPYIKRLSAAGVEAEIGSREARELQAAASDLPVLAEEPAPPAETAEQAAEAPTIGDLIDRDPPLGLAKLRIELENEVRRIYLDRLPDAEDRKLSLGFMAHELRDTGVLPAEVAGPLADVTALANRAIHGEYVPADVARDIAQVGLRVLGALRQIG